jgi:hypothetical protein
MIFWRISGSAGSFGILRFRAAIKAEEFAVEKN